MVVVTGVGECCTKSLLTPLEQLLDFTLTSSFDFKWAHFEEFLFSEKSVF